MIHAYEKIYLDKARNVLGRMFDYGVNDLGLDLEYFFFLFISSGYAKRFSQGDFNLLVGKSGVELAYEILEFYNISFERKKPIYTINRSEEYWTGWALAYYQWYTGYSFEDIREFISIEEIRSLYSPYHEMDIKHFVEYLEDIYKENKIKTRLKKYREYAGLTQKELSIIAEIPLRTIQQYEQRQKDINKAQVIYLYNLSKALHCHIEDLLER